jgi:membrane-bound inhibitor of C-type lysozyme
MECGGLSDDFYLIYELGELTQTSTNAHLKEIKPSDGRIFSYKCSEKHLFKVSLLNKTENKLNNLTFLKKISVTQLLSKIYFILSVIIRNTLY